MSTFNKFEEYKLFVEDTARFTDRRQNVTNVYVAVNTILLSAVALLLTEKTITRWLLALAAFAVLAGGVAVCLFWRQLIDKYKKLVSLRMTELRQLEEHPDMAGCHAMYHTEDQLYPPGKAVRAFSDLERQLPTAFMVLYASFALGIAIALATGAL